MRYYDLTLTPKGATTPFRQFTSHPGGTFDPGALNVEFDMPILPYDTPSGGVTITVEGVSLQDLNQQQQFAGMTLSLKAGMKAGLPLANPAQAGLIVTGDVFQAFGNWEGTEQTVDFVLLPSIYTNDNPGNIVLHWRAGVPHATALAQTLSVAYPGVPVSMNISDNIVNNYDVVAHYSTLDQLGRFIGDFTERNFDSRVRIAIQAGKITVSDDTFQPAPVQLNFNDFIGQPTWIEPQVIQIKTAMRADLSVGSIVKMPEGLQNAPGIIGTTAASLPSSLKYQSTFKNTFQVKELRQIGNFRSRDAANWCTVLNCVAN